MGTSVGMWPRFHSCFHQFIVLLALLVCSLSLSIRFIVLPDSIIAHFFYQSTAKTLKRYLINYPYLSDYGQTLFFSFFSVKGQSNVRPPGCLLFKSFQLMTPLARSISILTSSGLPLSSSGIVRWTDQLGFLANKRIVWYGSDSEILMTNVQFNVKI